MKIKPDNRFIPEAEIVFFDLDETITDRDTDSLWAVWRSRRELRGWGEQLRLIGLYWNYKHGRMTIDEYMEYHTYRLNGVPADKIRSMSEMFFLKSGKKHIYPEAEELVSLYIKNGARVVLLTAQNECVAGPFAGYLGIKDLIANRFTEENNFFTLPVKPYCFGEGKILYASGYAESAGIPLSRCSFYSDSIYDAPLLEKVGFPVAVNPDKFLYKKAMQNKWNIVYFGSGKKMSMNEY